MKRNVLIIVIVVVIVLAVAGFFGVQQMNASAASAARLQTTEVQRGTLVATVNAAGNVSAPNQATLAFQSTGRVAKVNVALGDKVKSGQVLMELDTTDLQLALKTAQTSLASAQADYDASQTNLPLALKTAQATLASAQANYDAQTTNLPLAVKTAQATLASAQANLDAEVAKNATNTDQLIVAKAALDKGTIALQQAQSAYDTVAWRSDVGMTTQAATLANATSDYNSALSTYKITAATINDTAVRTAQAQVDSAKAALEQAQHNQDTSLRTAQAQVDSAQAAVDQAQHNLDTSQRVAQASVDNAQVAVDQAQRNLDKARIIAPFDGTVAAVNYDVGDTAGTSSALVLADTTQLQVKVLVAEVDMAKIKVNETAQMTLDALPGATYNAKVIQVGPVGTVTQGVVNYPVTVAVTGNDGSEVKPGMTANLAIVVDQRQNVLLLPNRAIHTQGNLKVVTVLYKGQQITTPVQLGLENDTNAEITSGLQEGDVVLLTQTTTTQRTTGGGGIGIPGLGGFGGR